MSDIYAENRPLVLFLHGFAADSMNWAFNRPALADVADVLVPDLPGHGDALDRHQTGALSELVDHILRLLEPAQGRRLIIVGHSLGGGVALALAARPEVVPDALCLVAPVGLGNADREFLEAYPELEEAGDAEELLARLVADPRRITTQMVDAVLAHLQRPGARQALRDIVTRMDEIERACGEAAGIVAARDIPRRVLWGEQDQVAPLDIGALQQFGGDAIVLPESGHMPHMEQAQVVSSAIVEMVV